MGIAAGLKSEAPELPDVQGLAAEFANQVTTQAARGEGWNFVAADAVTWLPENLCTVALREAAAKCPEKKKAGADTEWAIDPDELPIYRLPEGTRQVWVESTEGLQQVRAQ